MISGDFCIVIGIFSTHLSVAGIIMARRRIRKASVARTETSTMSTRRINETISVADYLAGELVSNVKHEYIAGAVFAMVGARNAHNIIAVNALLAFGTRLKGHTCRPFNSDTKIRISMPDHVRFYYPDMSVVCEANALSETFQDQPVVIIEVLSEGTRRVDDGEKRDAYFTIPSLTHYILLEQDSVVAVVYERVGQQFKRHEFTSIDDVITLDSLSVSLPLRDLYDGVVSQ
jgi:Uma2 family endonuclease